MISMKHDPRCEPLAYITDGEHLFEVREQNNQTVILEDCADGSVLRLEAWRVRGDFRLVRRAPRAPDRLEQAA